MDLLTIISIASLITTIIGLYQLGEKKASGFITFTLSLLCQLYIFFMQKNWFLVCQMVVLIGFNIYNYFKWTKEN